ncbi:MAG: protein phosphatase 2C domain-containing protein [Spirochaetia bacterium]|nr:protein phosphatase 2C domain-containing protein [Spirochaetia bacterium]
MRIACASDVGERRLQNEDACEVFTLSIKEEQITVMLLADGMGGKKGGEIASKIFIDTLSSDIKKEFEKYEAELKSLPSNETLQTVKNLLHNSNNFIYKSFATAHNNIIKEGYKTGLAGMGTTGVAALFTRKTFHGFYIGDSRIYCFNNNNLTQMSTDHTHAQELIKSEQMTPAEAQKHPVNHILTKAVGASLNADKPSYCYRDVSPEDIFLVCSDGLHNELTNFKIEEIFIKSKKNKNSENYLNELAETFIETANNAGGRDNISVCIGMLKK